MSGKKKRQQLQTMKAEQLHGILQNLVGTYLMLLLAGLPLYMPQGLTLIGSAKYLYFRNVTLAIGAVMAVCAVVYVICARKEGYTIPGRPLSGLTWRERLCDTNLWLLLFVISTLISYAVSPEKETALWGYADWHMGLVTQLLLASICFTAFRWYDGSKWTWIVAGAAGMGVMLVGLLNRLDIDLLGEFNEIARDDWNRTHLISTIGNNDWYAGYISVVGGLFLVWMCRAKGWKRIAGAAGTFIYFATALTQGSTTGICAMLGIVFVFVLLALNSRRALLRALETALLLPVADIFLRLWMASGITGLVLETESLSEFLFVWGWFVCLGVLVLGYSVLRRREHAGKRDLLEGGKIRRIVFVILVLAIGIGCLAGLFILLSEDVRLWLEDVLGMTHYDRLAIWAKSLQAFLENSLLYQLFGAGPDCYYHVMYEWYSYGQELTMEGIWADAIYANAHNEWITMLINQGVLGAVTYAGFFLSALRKLWKRMPEWPEAAAGLLGICGYLICSVFTFQQVTSTPIVFALIGMGLNGEQHLCKSPQN